MQSNMPYIRDNRDFIRKIEVIQSIFSYTILVTADAVGYNL